MSDPALPQSGHAIIRGEMTVREILARYPASRAVLDRCGLLECGGPQGPVEPLWMFARVHRVPLPELLDELNRVA